MKNRINAFSVNFYDSDKENELGVEVAINEEFVKANGINFEEFTSKLELTAFKKIIQKGIEIYMRELKDGEMEEVE